MKRFITVLALAALLAAVVVATALPAFAAKGGNGGGAGVIKYEGCSTGVSSDPADACQQVSAPGGQTNVQTRDTTGDPGPSGGGGATVQEGNCQEGQTGHATTTPNGRTIANCGTRGG